MPTFEHLVNTPYVSSFRSKKIESQFDLSPEDNLSKQWNIDIPVENVEWNIGVIVGSSGSGKTSIGKVAFGEVDEYTSVVDRTVAKIGSSAIAKTARKLNKKIVLLSCHYDILEWLEPDWIYRIDTGEFQRGSLRRPDINIQIQRCHSSAWRLFREHHYLSHYLITHSECYMALVNGEPAAFFSFIYDRYGKRKNIVRAHRIVVLPDYQGIGLGNIGTQKLMRYYGEKGYIVKLITSHPALIHSFIKNKDYRLCSKVDLKGVQGATAETIRIVDLTRIKATFQYIGSRDKHLSNKKVKNSDF